ncbi:flavin-containing monooxygenase [Prauserella flavalba]|uniref:Steroid monooxygenase n=1 Tax=Prauserella flavalba TaxID=1477506 RepID=A0A318LET8_9PSEU|nr:NAD(P)/FAD-dependent oxidoreductase [Prauserella flavalba]PXY21542.1 steroid monooxygenase [Prauserella flavalba]
MADVTSPEYDAIVIGAGFSGLAMLHHLREIGQRTIVLEAGGGVGGTWYWNTYPGARTDSEFYYYSFSFSEEVRNEWVWTERYPSQPEVLRYLEFLASRLGLNKDIRLNTRVERAEYDESTRKWTVTTDSGDTLTATYLISGMGVLAEPNLPDIPGASSFAGELYHTARWPRDREVDLRGKRVGVIGLGASGVQIVPVVAEVAGELVVFQRTPNYVVASSNYTVDDEWMARVRKEYPENFKRAREHIFAVPFESPRHGAKELDPGERERIFEEKWREGGFHFMLETFSDLATDEESNHHASEFIRKKIRETVKDPETAELLCPKDYPFNGKRPPGGHGYYEAYNRDNVRLVDIREHGIDEITPDGVRVGGVHHELDVLIFATGFDAMTGTLTAIDIVGRDGVVLRDKWSDGLKTNLGLGVHGFPNFFMILGPQTPYANLPVAIQEGVQWIAGALKYARDNGITELESTKDAEEEWAAQVAEAGSATIMAKGVDANAWFIGANVPGKPIEFNVYMGGADDYFKRCDDVAAGGYRQFLGSDR